jgi:hypothetical protein
MCGKPLLRGRERRSATVQLPNTLTMADSAVVHLDERNSCWCMLEQIQCDFVCLCGTRELSMIPAIRLMLVVALLTAACGTKNDCLELAWQYAAAMPAALVCDPTVDVPCGAQRPTIVYQQDGQTLKLEGLSYCTHAVATGRTAEVDAILQTFRSEQCEFLYTPYWPPNQTVDPPVCLPGETCTGTDAGWTCAP